MAGEIQAPYNFVPLSEQVVKAPGEPEHSGLQDVPVPGEALSGVLEVRVHTDTPVFIGAKRGAADEEVPAYTVPGGQEAIPGSSLRGMLRNVVEIAGFGALAPRVNDHRYSVRDLQNPELYGNHLSAVVKHKKGKVPPYSFSCAGFLRPSPGTEAPAVIEICSFAKVHYDELIALAKSRHRGFDPGRRQSAPDKYRSWGESLEVRVQVDELWGDGEIVEGRRRRGAFGVVTDLGSGPQPGRLVFTGQPAPWPQKSKAKHHDFVFYGRHGTLPVDAPTLADFIFIHSDRGQQNRLTDRPNPELTWLLERFGGGARSLREWLSRGGSDVGIPVFFRTNDAGTEVRAIGLAMMFRLAYAHRVGEAASRAQGGPEGVEDLADRIFGYVPLERKGERKTERIARKGRVWIGDARPTGPIVRAEPVEAILASPKASFYPSYVEQGPPGALPTKVREYKTWQDADARPRGWKRVPPRRTPVAPHIPKEAKENQAMRTRFRPWSCPGGLVFKLRFHNLGLMELGAVLWALDFGGRRELRHTIGLAKQLGYGSVWLELEGGKLRSTLDWDSPIEGEGIAELVERARGAFVEFMEQALEDREEGGWAASRSIYELLANARVQDPGQRHLQIKHPVHQNEFVVAKKDKRVLPPTGDPGPWRRQIEGWRRTRSERRQAREERAQREERERVLEALLDESVPARERVERWAAERGDGAVWALRSWLRFKDPRGDGTDPVWTELDPMTSTLTCAVVGYLGEHGGLRKASKLPEPVRSLVEGCLSAGGPVGQAPKGAGERRVYEGTFPDWSGLKAKSRAKKRLAWAKKMGAGGPWDEASVEKMVEHLRGQGAPDGQIGALRRAQGRLLGVEME